jgi:hypothetical protein
MNSRSEFSVKMTTPDDCLPADDMSLSPVKIGAAARKMTALMKRRALKKTGLKPDRNRLRSEDDNAPILL